MREPLDVADAERAGRRHHRFLLASRRRDLGRGHVTVREQDGVGERPPDIDAQHRHPRDSRCKDVVVRAAAVAFLACLLAQTGAAATFPRATAVIDTGERRIRVTVEVADEPDEWRIGLMHRRSLARNAGMIFVFPQSTRGGFWMKNTLIPLSIAFFDGRGRIVRILVMAPCRADPCPTYDPKVAYRGALEVNRGSFGRWGVRRGDVIRLAR